MYASHSNSQFLEDLYTRHYTMVYQLIAHRLQLYVRTVADATDLTQEVFILAAKKIDILRGHPNPAGFLCKAAYHVSQNHIRSKAKRGEHLSESLDLYPDESDVYAAVDTQLSMESMLSENDYALLCAYCIEKRPREELCAHYGLSAQALRVRVHRLRKYLWQNLIFFVTLAIRRYI